MAKQTVIVSAARTPIGSFLGSLQSLSAAELGSLSIKAVVKKATILASEVDEVIMGEVLSAGAGQAPARQAALGAGISNAAPCLTINKVCGSGLKAVMDASDAILLGRSEIVVAGGMESMSQAPYLLSKARNGFRMGNQTVVDSMVHDGLWDPYESSHMGSYGDKCASHYEITRQAQDTFAKESYEKALQAQKNAEFKDEIVPVTIKQKREQIIVDKDEEPGRYKPEKIESLRPVFSSEGTVTAANASKINDGAAAVLLMNEATAVKRGLKPLAKITFTSAVACDPCWFTTAPVKAIETVLDKANLTVDDIDLFEINEAFSVVPLVAMKKLNIPAGKVNVKGGAVALGHPIGCSGARILTTLLYALQDHSAKRGLATLCIGGGEAVAVIIERVG